MKRSTIFLSLGIWFSSVVVAFIAGRTLYPGSDNTTGANRASAPQSAPDGRIDNDDAILNELRGDDASASATDALRATGEQSVAWPMDGIQNLSADDARRLLGTAFAMPKSDPNRSKVINALLSQLAATDPVGAMELASQIGSLRDSERAKVAILKVWASNDPTAALTWAKTALLNEPTNLRNSQMRAIIQGYTQTDPVAAFLYVNALAGESPAELRQKNLLLREVIEIQIQNGGLSEARTAVEMLAEGPTKDSLLRELIDEWASFDPENAAAYVASLGPDAPASLKTALIGEWAENDPVAAAAWLNALPEGDPAYANSTAEIIREWTRYDLNAPAEWLNSLPDSPELDRAIASYTYRAAQEDPANAMSWAESISNDRMRMGLMERVAATWKTEDPESFGSYLENSDLSDEQKAELEHAKSRGHGNRGGGPPP